MMIINKDYKIESDELNVSLYKRQIVEKEGKTKGNEYWVAIGHWGSVEHALRGLVDLRIKGTGMKDLESIVKEIESIKKDISRLN